MFKIFEVVTDGKVFRITERGRGEDARFVGIPGPLEFSSKEAAQEYIHKHLSMGGWRKA